MLVTDTEMKNEKKYAVRQMGSRVFPGLDILFLIVSTGFQLFLTLFIIFEWKYPCIYQWGWATIAFLIVLFPILSIWPWVIYKKWKKKKYPKGAGLLSVVLVLFFLLPSLFVGVCTPVCSRTRNIRNYLKVDSYVDKDDFFEELFPDEIPMKSGKEGEGGIDTTNPCYFYQCIGNLDISSDIYAQWTLSKEDFDLEVNRNLELFARYPYYNYVQMQRGDYICMIRYDSVDEFEPFTVREHNYTVYIFAYNEKTNQVRYIYSNSTGSHKPHYLTLAWEE